MSSLSALITNARKSVFASQASAAEQYGIHRNTQAKYESGAIVPDIGYMALLAEKSGFKFSWFVSAALNDDETVSKQVHDTVINQLTVAGGESKPLDTNAVIDISNVVIDISNVGSIGSVRVNGRDFHSNKVEL